jgi:hypothetical protein
MMNRRQFARNVAMGGAVGLAGLDSFLTVGCSAEEWFKVIAGLIPVAIQTVGGLTLGPLGLSAADLAFLNSFSQGAVTILNDIEADVNLVTSSDTSAIPTIDSLVQQLQTQTNGVLSSLHVTNATSLKNITAWVNSILADVVDIANLVPVFQQSAPSPTAAARVKIVRMKTSLPKASALQSVFQQRLAAVKALN